MHIAYNVISVHNNNKTFGNKQHSPFLHRLRNPHTAVLSDSDLSLYDTQISAVMDYFEIFMGRMILCRKAAEKLGLTFKLVINDQQLL